MQNAAGGTQAPSAEPRNETVGVKATASEKDAVRFLALVRKTSESELFRARLAEIEAEAEQMRTRLAEGA